MSQPREAAPALPEAPPELGWEPVPALVTPHLSVVAGAAPGSKRLDRSSPVPGDDRWRVVHTHIGRTPVVVVAVADGAGSAQAGGLGATVATAEAVRSSLQLLRTRATAGLRRCPTRRDGAALVAAVRAQVHAAAAAAGLSARDLASTLLLAVLAPRFTWIVQVGDGAVVGMLPGVDSPQLACWPQQGEYANQTHFVADADAQPVVVRWPASDALAVLTDGLQHLALYSATRSAHPGFFAPLWQALRAHDPARLAPQLSAWLASAAIAERTDDDVTLVLAVRQPGTVRPA